MSRNMEVTMYINKQGVCCRWERAQQLRKCYVTLEAGCNESVLVSDATPELQSSIRIS